MLRRICGVPVFLMGATLSGSCVYLLLARRLALGDVFPCLSLFVFSIGAMYVGVKWMRGETAGAEPTGQIGSNAPPRDRNSASRSRRKSDSPGLRTHTTFFSKAFNQTKVKKNFINPCCFGEDLAKWLIPHLNSCDKNFEIDPEPCQEDWGWEVLLTCNGRGFFIGIGQYEMEDRGKGWLCFVESQLPFFKKWFGISDAAEQKRICTALHSVLSSSGDIKDIRWHIKEEFMEGNEDAWKKEPDV